MEEEDGEPREQRFEFQRFFEKGGETTGKDGREEGREEVRGVDETRVPLEKTVED